MKRILVALAFAAMVGSASATDRPDFSGEWKMNPTKSAYGPIPMPAWFVRKISHRGRSITIAEDQTGGGIDLVPSRHYVIDGESATFSINGAEVTGSVSWVGADLRVQSKVNAAGLQFDDRMSLSADRRELTSRVQIVSDQGTIEMTIVFERQ